MRGGVNITGGPLYYDSLKFFILYFAYPYWVVKNFKEPIRRGLPNCGT